MVLSINVTLPFLCYLYIYLAKICFIDRTFFVLSMAQTHIFNSGWLYFRIYITGAIVNKIRSVIGQKKLTYITKDRTFFVLSMAQTHSFNSGWLCFRIYIAEAIVNKILKTI